MAFRHDDPNAPTVGRLLAALFHFGRLRPLQDRRQQPDRRRHRLGGRRVDDIQRPRPWRDDDDIKPK